MIPRHWIDHRCGGTVIRVWAFHRAPDRVRKPREEPCQIVILPVIRIERCVPSRPRGALNSHDRGFA